VDIINYFLCSDFKICFMSQCFVSFFLAKTIFVNVNLGIKKLFVKNKTNNGCLSISQIFLEAPNALEESTNSP